MNRRFCSECGVPTVNTIQGMCSYCLLRRKQGDLREVVLTSPFKREVLTTTVAALTPPPLTPTPQPITFARPHMRCKHCDIPIINFAFQGAGQEWWHCPPGAQMYRSCKPVEEQVPDDGDLEIA